MKIYARSYNFDDEAVYTAEIPDDLYEEIIENSDYEGEAWYEDLTNTARLIIEAYVPNPFEAYESYEEAAAYFAPFLCW